MATAPSPAPSADERGRVQSRLSFVLPLIGPAVLLVGSALVIGGLFLPWYHSDPRFLVGDPYPNDFLPFVPMQSFDAGALFCLVLAAIPIMFALACLLIDATPRLRGHGNVLRSAVSFGLLTLVVGGVGIISLILYQGFLGLAGTVPHLLDSGYFVSVAGFILLVASTILLMIGQMRVRKVVRLGQLRAL